MATAETFNDGFGPDRLTSCPLPRCKGHYDGRTVTPEKALLREKEEYNEENDDEATVFMNPEVKVESVPSIGQKRT